MVRVKSKKGLVAASFVTTFGAICIAQVLALWIYPVSSGSTAYIFTPVIALCTAFPISLLLWTKIRQNLILGEELQKLIDRDRLTQTATRDYFFARMEEAPDAYGVSLMVDIDHFKQVNDTHGHLAGDRVIAEVAAILSANMRSGDIVCRFGGEEFVIFLLEMGRRDAMVVAERMRALVEQHLIIYQGLEIQVTVSIGGALKRHAGSVMTSLQQADAALYLAKQQGRNRTVFEPQQNAGKEAIRSTGQDAVPDVQAAASPDTEAEAKPAARTGHWQASAHNSGQLAFD